MRTLSKILLFNIGLLLSITLCAQTRYVVPTAQSSVVKSYYYLIAQVGTTETGSNRGKRVDNYNITIGNPLGSPYCQAGQYWCYYQASKDLGLGTYDIPMPRNGLANSTFNYAMRLGKKTGYNPQVHDFIIWRSPNGVTGHIERIISVGRAGWVTTVGFNTSPSSGGSQSNGDGVWRRQRNIRHPLGSRMIRGLVGVN